MSTQETRQTRGRIVLLVIGTTLTLAALSAGVLFVGGPDGVTQDAAIGQSEQNVSEPAIEKPAPEPGDEWYEATAADESWISYINPRDEYRSPYLGSGSGKICVTLLNEAGDPVTGESIPDTTVTIPTGESIEWHSSADPFVVEFPMADHYERPIDADQFGTSDDVPQGDGYLDSHCIEWHGLPEDGEIEYGEAEIEGEHADDIDLVGYVQQDDQAWDSAVDPLEDAVSYEEAGGGWTYSEPLSHGQVVVVLQLTGIEGGETGEDESDDVDPTDDGAGSSDDESDDADVQSDDRDDDTAPSNESASESNESSGEASVPDNETPENGDDGSGANESDTDDGLPGFGLVGAMLAVAVLSVLLGIRRRRSQETEFVG